MSQEIEASNKSVKGDLHTTNEPMQGGIQQITDQSHAEIGIVNTNAIETNGQEKPTDEKDWMSEKMRNARKDREDSHRE